MKTSNAGAEPGVSSAQTQHRETTEHEEGEDIERKELISAKIDDENHTLKGKHCTMICNLEDSNIIMLYYRHSTMNIATQLKF